MGVVPGRRSPVPLTVAPATIRPEAEDLLVAATVATEVPPIEIHAPHTEQVFTRGAIPLAVQAVCEVVQNRAESTAFQSSPIGVVLSLKQFSAVLRGLSLSQVGKRDVWLDAVTGAWQPEHVGLCLELWRALREGRQTDRLVPGVMWYYSPVSMRPPLSAPSWAAKLVEIEVPEIPSDYFRWFRPPGWQAGHP